MLSMHRLVAVDIGVDNDNDDDGDVGSNALEVNSLSPIFLLFIPISCYISKHFELHRNDCQSKM